MPPALAVGTLVGDVLAELAEDVRSRCDQERILAALDELGCASSPRS